MSDLITIKLFGRTIALPATLEAQVEKDKDYPTEEETTTIVSKNREEESPKNSDDKEEENDSSGSQQERKDSGNSQENKPLKKAEKIVACPRCNSLETKFCYFNNYNVNQPRHFCKNCQRYWTHGGTTRNVPVGAGRRRKSKNSIASQYRHLTVPDEHINGTVLSFGSPNGFHSMEDQSSESSVTSNDEGIIDKLKDPVTIQVPYLQFYPRQSYWGWSSSSVTSGSLIGSIPNSAILGKHTREVDVHSRSNSSEIREERRGEIRAQLTNFKESSKGIY